MKGYTKDEWILIELLAEAESQYRERLGKAFAKKNITRFSQIKNWSVKDLLGLEKIGKRTVLGLAQSFHWNNLKQGKLATELASLLQSVQK